MKIIKSLSLCLIGIIVNCIGPQPSQAQSLQGQPFIDSLLQQLPNAKNDTSRAKIFSRLSTAFAPNDSAEAFNYANKCINISKQARWAKGIGLAYYAFATAYYNISDYTTSLQNSQRAYDIFKRLDDKDKIGAALLMIGTNYRELGYYTKAIENDFAALRLFEEINNKYGIKECYNNIGNSYYYIYDFDKARENYNKALAVNRELKNKYGIACQLDNISSVFVEKGEYDSANNYNLQAIKIFEEINNQPELSRAYFNRGDILRKLYDERSAYEYYMRATEIDKKLSIKTELAYDYGGTGELYLEIAKDTTGKYIIPSLFKTDKKSLLQKAQHYFTQALSLAKVTGDIRLLMSCTKNASETEEHLADYKSALAYHKEYMQYHDSIFNDENKKKATALETQRLAEVKDKEIQLLNKDKALQASEIKRQTLIKNIIIASVVVAAIFTFFLMRSFIRRRKVIFDKQVLQTEMKALRAQMNPHFIFNSLHSINKYVMENDKVNAAQYLSKFAKLMRLVLENSREQEVPLESDLTALELYMQLESLRFENRFQYCIEVDPSIDKENTLVPPLMLQPFAENAIVHGIKDKEDGLIKINIYAENDNMLRCIVEDNGAGRETSPIAEENNRKPKSLGMKIMQERLNIINQLKKAKAVINIFDLKDAENKPGGLRIELLLPLQLAF